MSIGAKIMPNSLEDYNKIVSTRKSKNLTFFTHPIKDNQKFKFVLYGIRQINTKTINKEFKSMNIEPIKERNSNLSY